MGGGGPAKAAEPKVTPFVDYSAQTPDIPNWFAGRTANTATFTPDFSQSQTAFGNTGIVPPALPQQAQFQPQVQPVPQSGMMRNDDPRRNQNSFDGRMPFPPDGFEDPFARRMRFAIPTQHMGGEEMMRPRRPRAAYQNYTDTDPTMSTGADGAPLMGPNSIWPGRR